MRVQLIAAFVFLASALAAQAPSDERFYQAVRNNDLAALRKLIAAEGVNARDGLGQTPLMLASAFGSLDAVRALLAAGADARAGSNAGVTALHWAATSPEKTRALLDAGADVDRRAPDGATALMKAVLWGDLETIDLLLAHGADVHALDRDGWSPLRIARAKGDHPAERRLTARGAAL